MELDYLLCGDVGTYLSRDLFCDRALTLFHSCCSDSLPDIIQRSMIEQCTIEFLRD